MEKIRLYTQDNPKQDSLDYDQYALTRKRYCFPKSHKKYTIESCKYSIPLKYRSSDEEYIYHC